MNDQSPKNFDSVDSRRSTSSRRKLGPARRLYYFLGLPLVRGLIWLLRSTYRVEKIIGAENIEPFIDEGRVCAPAYWHQHQVIGLTGIRGWIQRGFKA